MQNTQYSSEAHAGSGAPLRRSLWGGALAACTAVALLAPMTPANATAPAQPASSTAAPQAMTQERINTANDAYNGAAATLEFITMSDTELMGGPTEGKTSEQVAYDGAKPHFVNLRAWADDKGFDARAIVNNGDVVGVNDPEYNAHLAGNSEKPAGWYRAVERVMRESFPEANVLLTQGNHDIADLMGKTFDEARAQHAPEGAPEWFYPNADTEYVSNFHTTIEGIDFIGLDYNGKSTYGYAGQQTGYQEYLTKTLAGIAAKPDYDKTKPIFVSMHSGYGSTTLGGPFRNKQDMAGPDLMRILADYPQAVLGSAHSHFSSNPETSIYQKDFTVYENASMNYIYQSVPGDFIGGEYFGGNQGDAAAGISQKSANFVTVLEDGDTVIRRFDVTHQRWLGMPWVIDTSKGKDGFTYTDDQRSKVAPWWDAAAVTASDVTETSLTLEFDQAKDDELVNFYEVEITDQAGNPVPFTANQVPDFGNNAPKSLNGSFKAYSRFYMTPNTMGFDIKGLKAAKTYNVKVSAFDDFENRSEPLTGTVRTAGTLVFPEYPETAAPAPTGEFLNLPFEGDLTDEGTAAAAAPEYSAVGSVSYVDTDRRGAAGQAVRIGTGNGSYVNLGKRAEFDLGTDKDLTISFWAKVTGLNGYGAMISNKNWANWYRSGINVAPEYTNTSRLEFTLGDGKNGVYTTGDVADFRNSWHLMTVSVDRTRNIASTYMDGVLAKEMDISGVGDMTSELDMHIGVDGLKNYGLGFDMDDLKMWDTPLTAAEVAGLYAAADATAETEALTGAVEYAKDLVAANEVHATNGRVFDPALDEALAAALTQSETALADAAPAKDALRAGYDALKSAVDSVEAQAVRFAYAVESSNGEVTPAEGVADLDGELRLALKPAAGFQIKDAVIDVTGADSFAVSGEELVLTGVQGKVLVSVAFAKVVDGGPGDGGPGDGDGDGGPGDGGPGDGGPGDGGPGDGGPGDGGPGTPGDGAQPGENGGKGSGSLSRDGLAATGGDPVTAWLLAGAATAMLAAAGGVLWLRTRMRRQ